jgi:hypothetical protein
MTSRRRRVFQSLSYQPKGWAHHLEYDLREQEEDSALRRARRRQLRELDKKIQRAKVELWREIHGKHPSSPQLT